jgi:hypothetical protein
MTINELHKKIQAIEERLRKEAHLLSPRLREGIERRLDLLNDIFIAKVNELNAKKKS